MGGCGAVVWPGQPTSPIWQRSALRLRPEELAAARLSVRQGVEAARAGGRASTRTELVPEHLREADGSRRPPGGAGQQQEAVALRSEEEELRMAIEQSLQEDHHAAAVGPAAAMDPEASLQAAIVASLHDMHQHTFGSGEADNPFVVDD